MDGSDVTASALGDIERAMVRIRRSQTRRTLGRLAIREGGQGFDLSLAPVLDAVEEGSDATGQEVTVGIVAERLGLDPSRASRLVSRAIQGGYVARVASQTDGRRIRLELTPAGHELAQAGHRFRRGMFERLMADWSDGDREDFARLLTRFTDALAEEVRGAG